VLDTIQRRNFTVATMSGGYLYLVKVDMGLGFRV
jgi:hypothetical protein